MRYKTLFRIGLKLIGIWILAQTAGPIAGTLTHIAALHRRHGAWSFWSFWWTPDLLLPFFVPLVESAVMLVIGLYLFLGGRWIVNVAVPSNRPYCPECGYDSFHRSGEICPECGTPIETTPSPRQTLD
jgi:hypothetical protein